MDSKLHVIGDTHVSPTRHMCLRTGTHRAMTVETPFAVSLDSEGTHHTDQNGFLKGHPSLH